MGRIYSRKTTCNELISADQRAQVVDLFTETHRTYHQISMTTGVPIAKIKNMTAGMNRPIPSKPLSGAEMMRLLLQW